MVRIAGLLLAVLPLSTGAAAARDLVYAARIGADGAMAEQRTLACDLATGCILVFDAAAEDWRNPLSLQLTAAGGQMILTGRSEGVPDQPLLVASRRVALDRQGGVVTTLVLAPPASRRAQPASLAGDRPGEGFGPFLIAVHHVPD